MFNITSNQPMYDPQAVQPLRDELVAVGFDELLTPEDVDKAINVKDNKTVLVMINSVCGCAAGTARPGVSLALQNDIIPDRLTTVFAGQEKDAVARVRSYIKNFPPSSPSVALFKNGELIYFMQRYDIEGYTADHIASELVQAFNQLCSATGPSISPENYEKVVYAKTCGSKIPLFKQ
jgi:putative YphP/YqiW family bacilliredoxin